MINGGGGGGEGDFGQWIKLQQPPLLLLSVAPRPRLSLLAEPESSTAERYRQRIRGASGFSDETMDSFGVFYTDGIHYNCFVSEWPIRLSQSMGKAC